MEFLTHNFDFSPTSVKQLSKLPESISKRIIRKIYSIRDEPGSFCEPLTDHQGLYKLRTGDYRIIMRILKNELTIPTLDRQASIPPKALRHKLGI